MDLLAKPPEPDDDESARWVGMLPWVQELAEQARAAGRPPLRILDVGCSRGWLVRLLSAYGEAQGLESDGAADERARRRLHAAEWTAARSPGRRFDLVVSSGVLEQLPADEQAGFVAALAQLLEPGGRLLLTTRRDGPGAWARPRPPPLPEERVEALCDRAGLRAVGRGDVWFDVTAGVFAPLGGAGVGDGLVPMHRIWCFRAGGAAAARAPSPPPCAGTSFDPDRPDYANTPASPLRPRRAYRPADPAADPAVTVVTPFFNAGPVFHETALSLSRQSLQQWEWVIVDDGSTEPESLRLLEAYVRCEPRIRVVRHAANRGLSAARNTGYREARAGLVFQLDADDLIEPTALEKSAWHLATHPGFAFTGGFGVGFGAEQYLWRHGFHSGRRFLDQNLVTATKLVRKSVHQAIGGYDEENRNGLEDWDFWLRAAAHGHWGSTVPEFFDWYRRRDTGRDHWTNVVHEEKTASFRAGLRRRYPTLWERFPDVEAGRLRAPSAPGAPLPFENLLAGQHRPRALFVLAHLAPGGADTLDLEHLGRAQRDHGFEITVAATRPSPHPAQREFERLTPDVFALNRFVHETDVLLFLRYLVRSRRPDVVCVGGGLRDCPMVRELRGRFPEIPFIDPATWYRDAGRKAGPLRAPPTAPDLPPSRASIDAREPPATRAGPGTRK